MKKVRAVWLLLRPCVILCFATLALSCSAEDDNAELAQKIDSVSSKHGVQEQIGPVASWYKINDHIDKILIIGKTEAEVFEFAQSIDARMIPVTRCYVMQFFEYEDKLDRYLCFKEGHLHSADQLDSR